MKSSGKRLKNAVTLCLNIRRGKTASALTTVTNRRERTHDQYDEDGEHMRKDEGTKRYTEKYRRIRIKR